MKSNTKYIQVSANAN